MESDPFELPDQHAHEDYQPYTYGTYGDSQEDENISGINSGIPFRSEEMEHLSGRKPTGGDTKLYRNIVKKYGPGEPKEYTYTSDRQMLRERSPPQQTTHYSGDVYSQQRTNKWKQPQENLQPKFSFHPQVGEMPKDIYKESGRKIEISKEEQWERILKPKTEVLQDRERQKVEKEAQDLQENCSFQPNVNKSYQLNSAKYVTNKSPSVTDRLYAEGMDKLKTKEMEKRRNDADAECTFTPDVTKSVSYLKGDRAAQKPLHERLGDIMKQKQEFLQRARMEAELNNKDLAFRPALNEHSQILADAKKQVQDVTERLVKDATDKVYKKMKQTEEYESQLTSQCPFRPNVNPISQSNDQLLSGNDLYVMQKDVVTRQYLMADIQRENLQKKAAEIIAQEGCTFAPKVNKISQFLIEADPSRVNESEQEKYDRLSKKDAQKREIFQEQMQKAHYDQFTYRPEINQISKDIGKKATLDELAYNRDGKEHIRILREKSIDNMLSECSFRPQLNKNKKYENAEPLYSNEEQIMDNIKLHNKKKEIKYDQLKKVEEYNEMRECTFKPKIKGEIDEAALKPKLTQSVAGLDKFMQMRDRHKKQQLEKRKREEEIFHIEKKYSAAKHEGFTTPQPFALSKGSKSSIREAKVAQEMREKMSNYTFKPSTNEGKNREIINKLISNPEGIKIK